MSDYRLEPDPESDRIYLEVEDWELGKCAMCQKKISISGEILIHIAMCLECESMVQDYAESYQSETSH